MTIPPRSLSSLVDPNGHRILRLPNGTCTYIYGDGRWAGEGEGDPLEYLGWAWEWLSHDQVRAEITDLTDEEIRAICMAPAGECEGVIARIAASRKIPRERFRPAIGELSAEAKAARAPLRPEELIEAQHDRVHRDPGRARAARTVRILPRDGREDRIAQIRASRPAESAGAREEGLCSLSVESDGDRLLAYPDGSWQWLFSDTYVSEASTLNPESVRRPNIPIEIHLTRDEATALLPRDGRAEKIAALLAHDRAARAPSLRAQGLGASEPTWEEPEDLVAEPPHYQLPGGREALEDVIAPICDALSDRRLPGSAVYMVGNALKYLSRLGAKGSALEDLRKAREYLDRAIARMDAGA